MQKSQNYDLLIYNTITTNHSATWNFNNVPSKNTMSPPE